MINKIEIENSDSFQVIGVPKIFEVYSDENNWPEYALINDAERSVQDTRFNIRINNEIVSNNKVKIISERGIPNQKIDSVFKILVYPDEIQGKNVLIFRNNTKEPFAATITVIKNKPDSGVIETLELEDKNNSDDIKDLNKDLNKVNNNLGFKNLNNQTIEKYIEQTYNTKKVFNDLEENLKDNYLKKIDISELKKTVNTINNDYVNKEGLKTQIGFSDSDFEGSSAGFKAYLQGLFGFSYEELKKKNIKQNIVENLLTRTQLKGLAGFSDQDFKSEKITIKSYIQDCLGFSFSRMREKSLWQHMLEAAATPESFHFKEFDRSKNSPYHSLGLGTLSLSDNQSYSIFDLGGKTNDKIQFEREIGTRIIEGQRRKFTESFSGSYKIKQLQNEFKSRYLISVNLNGTLAINSAGVSNNIPISSNLYNYFKGFVIRLKNSEYKDMVLLETGQNDVFRENSMILIKCNFENGSIDSRNKSSIKINRSLRVDFVIECNKGS